jgi:hypothetical protein
MSKPHVPFYHDMIYYGFNGVTLSWSSRFTSLEHMMGSDDVSILEMYGPDDDVIEVVFVDGVPAGTIDGEPRLDFSEYETLDQIHLREGHEDAMREDRHDERMAELREARNA